MMSLLGVGCAGVVAVVAWTLFALLLVLPLPVVAWVLHHREVRRARATAAPATIVAARTTEVVAAA